MGSWHGQAATELGLAGDVSRDALLRTWEGRDPSSGELLVRSGHKEHIAAIDCTFSAPKSVSLVWALGDAEHRAAIEARQDRAVEVALDHIERHAALVRRRIDGKIRHEQAAGIVAARFRHHTSRLCAEQHAQGLAPDPQLHDHCTIANLALRREDAAARNGRWAAVDSRELYRIAAEAGAVYRAELAAGLQQLGYGVVREGRYFEVEGVPVEVRRAFSARALEVEAAVQRFVGVHGRRPTDEEARNLVVLSRQPKGQEQPSAFAQWQQRATALGFGPAQAAGLRSHDRLPAADSATTVAEIVAELTDPHSPHALTAATAAFDRRELRIAVAEAAQGRVPGAEVDDLLTTVEASPQLVRLDAVHWTTRPMLRAEREALAAAQTRGQATGRGIDELTVTGAIQAARVPLDDEQRAAVRRLCGEEAIALLSAPAGAGKGEVLQAVTAALQAEGRRVLALAAAGDTAQRLGEQTGADQALTVDAFIRRLETGSLTVGSRDLVVVDEASLLETWRWQGLLRATQDAEQGAKVIAAGDGRQLSPIAAGGLWPLLEQRVGVTELSANYRAQDQWAQDAWAALREGHSSAAMNELDSRGQILVEENRLQARARAVERWDQDRRQGAERGRSIDQYLLAVDGSNREVDDLNHLAQQRRLEKSELAGDPIHVVAHDRERDRTREEDLYAGDRVSFQRPLYLDRVPGEQRRRVENGETGTVLATDPEAATVTVQLRERQVTIGADNLDVLRLGYAQHVYSSQGRTVDRVYVVTGGWQTDRESSYVGVSRAREASYVITDYSSLDVEPGDRPAAVAELADRCGQSRAKVAALSLAERAGWRREQPTHDAPEQAQVAPETAAGSAPAGSRSSAGTAVARAARRRSSSVDDAPVYQPGPEAEALQPGRDAGARPDAHEPGAGDAARQHGPTQSA